MHKEVAYLEVDQNTGASYRQSNPTGVRPEAQWNARVAGAHPNAADVLLELEAENEDLRQQAAELALQIYTMRENKRSR